jgi:hypothetical protein
MISIIYYDLDQLQWQHPKRLRLFKAEQLLEPIELAPQYGVAMTLLVCNA